MPAHTLFRHRTSNPLEPHRSLRLGFALLVGCLCAALETVGAQLTGYTFTAVADTAPTSRFSNVLAPPVINQRGDVAFAAALRAGGAGIYKWDSATGQLVTIFEDPSLAAFNFATRFIYPALDDAGNVTFQIGNAIRRGSGAGLQTVVDGGGSFLLPVAGNPSLPVTQVTLRSRTADASGRVVVFCDMGRGFGTYLAGSGPLVKLTDFSYDVTPPPSPTLFESPVDISSNGRAAGAGRFAVGSATRILLRSGATGPEVLLDQNAFAGAGGSGQFGINNSGRIAYQATQNSGGISGTAIFTIDSANSPVPITDVSGVYRQALTPSINNLNELVWVDGTRNGLFNGPDPVANKIIGALDPLLNYSGAVASIQLNHPGINDAGGLAFLTRLNNSTLVVTRGIKSVVAQTGNPVPTVASLSPSSAVINSGAFTLTVTGQGFVNGTTVQWNGANRTTTFVSSTQVTGAISSADVATAGTAQVTVVSPAPGGGSSAPRSFSVTAGPLAGPPTLNLVLPLNRGVYLNDRPLLIRFSVGGDQSGVANFLVTFDGIQTVIQPPGLETAASHLINTGWRPVVVQARNSGNAVVASARSDVLVVDGPMIRNILSILSLIVRDSPPIVAASPPRPSSRLRQALLAAAADVLDINLDVFRAFRNNVLAATAAGRYYTDVYQRTSFALIEIAARDPAQALAIHQAVLDWTPAIQALVNQQGSTVTISPAMAAQAQTLLTNLRKSATGELATIMDTEIAALNPSSWSGMTIGQLLARVESQPRTSPTQVASGRISNMSIRSSAGTGAQTLIVGAVIGGVGTSGNKPLLIRGVGPALTSFGVPGALADPILSVFAGTNIVASNDNWSGDAQVTAIGNAVGAFGLTPATSRDAALYAPVLAPRDYTIQITGVGGGTGVVLAEIYDATLANSFTATTPQLINVSARTEVGTGADILIAGFTLGGETPRRVLIRAVGPTLGAFGVTGALADPQLALFSGTNRLQENNDWGAATNAAEVTAATTQLGTFQLDAGARDSAILTTLQPGSYTAQISGVGNTTGVALVEIYVVP